VSETKYFTIGMMPERSNHRHVELIQDAMDRRGETIMKIQDGPSARELVERGLL
jgi:hypothetical protein